MDTFSEKYSSWYQPLNRRQEHIYKDLEKVVLDFNKDCKAEVNRSKEKFNLKIRGVIADKTGVSLAHKKKGAEIREIELKEKEFIQIRIVDYVPTSLLEVFEKYDGNIIELLIHYRRMVSTLNELDYQMNKYANFSSFHHEACTFASLQDTYTHLRRLVEKVEDSGILKAIKNLGPDVFGAYFPGSKKVEIYWLPISLGGIVLDLPLEEFALVILIHELVHGYTHIGFDKDGHNWETTSFASADLRIVEGFAQAYTEMLCQDYFESALKAFDALLTEQSTEYTTYKNWFAEKESYKYEKLRRVLLKTRSSREIKYDEFLHNLEIIKKDF